MHTWGVASPSWVFCSLLPVNSSSILLLLCLSLLLTIAAASCCCSLSLSFRSLTHTGGAALLRCLPEAEQQPEAEHSTSLMQAEHQLVQLEAEQHSLTPEERPFLGVFLRQSSSRRQSTASA